MTLRGKTILLTGAAGGIGAPLAQSLARQGAHLILSDHNLITLKNLESNIRSSGGSVSNIPCNLLDPDGPLQLVEALRAYPRPLDTLINLAGRIRFGLFHHESAEALEEIWRINTLAPMQLTRLVLDGMIRRSSGHIVNIGSVYGSIGFPGFATYSASKFAVRGFSEALRRELEGTGVHVTYIGPRYVKTPINQGAIQRMSEELKVNMDDAQTVAERIVEAMLRQRKEAFIGFPESLFVRVNSAFPQLLDHALKKQLPTIRRYAARSPNDMQP